MPKASKATASEHVVVEGYEGHFERAGDWTIGFERYTADADLAPFFVGLPDDRCQCPHLGYVIEGKVKFTFSDGTEELYETGDAYYAPPGHTPHLYAGSRVLEFSPSKELDQTMEVVTKNMEAAGAA
jgi:Cupin domain